MIKIFNFQFSIFKWAFVYSFIGLFVYSFISAVPANAAAGINKEINFQGKLVDNNGLNVADNTYSIIFSIYNVASGGSATWTETDSVTTSNGIFQVPLGAVTSLPGTIDFNSDTWYLGIKVSTETNEMSPRIRLTAVPYAFNAAEVNGLSVTNNGGNTLNISANKTLTVSDTTTLANGGLTLANGKSLTLSDSTTLGTNAITLAGGEVITFTASNALTLTTTGSTNVTLPTSGTLAVLGANTFAGAETIQSNASTALTVGANGSTNPVLQIDASTGSVATGLKIAGAATGGTTGLTVIDSGSNANLSLDAKGSGTVTINGTGTGVTTVGHGLTLTSGTTLTLTGDTIAGTPTWSSNQGITLSTASQPNITSLGTLTGLTVTSSASSGNPLALSTTSMSTGASLKITGGTAVTTGGDMDINGAVYIHTAAETGDLAKYTFSDNSTNTSGNSVTNGLDIESAFTTSGAGTKAITGLNISSPTTQSCTTGACTWTGLKITTPASAASVTASGLDILAGGAAGADLASISTNGNGVTTAGVNALQITYDGGAANIESGAVRVNLNPGGTSGGVWNGFRMVANTTGPATGVTETGLKVEGPTTGGVGTFNGVNVINLLPGAGGTVNGVNLITSAFTQTTAVTGTINGLNLGTAGALTQSTNAGTINWNGLAIQNPNITQSTGTVTGNGLKITTGTNTTGGTQNGLNIAASGVSVGTLNGISISGITPGAGAETGLNIGAGWDKSIAIATNATGQGMVVTAGAVPTADMVNITNAGQGVTTAGVNALSVNYVGGSAAVEAGAFRIDLTPGGTSGGTWNGLRFVANSTGPVSGVTETGLKVEAPTSGGVGTFNGVNILGLIPGAGGTVNGVNLTTSAFTQSTAVTGAITGLNLGTAGALVQQTAAGTINWNGLAITNPNITQSTGTVNSTGLAITVGTITTGGNQTGIKITPSNSNAAGTETGIDLSTALTAGAATERAISIGKGWDASIAFGPQAANDNTAQGVIQFASSGNGASSCSSATSQGLVIKDQGGTQRGHFCFDNSNLEGFGLAWTASATDVAENYSDVANVLQPGDLVSLDSTGPAKSVRKTVGQYDQLLFGIVSTQPGLLLSDVDESNGTTDLINQKPIALTGRVPTYVDSENGAIAVGDYITSSSTPGVGMKATGPGSVIGQALQAYDGSGTGTIYVFVRAGYYNGQGNLVNPPPTPIQVADVPQPATPAATVSSIPQDLTLNSLSVLGLATISADLHVQQNALIEGILHIVDSLVTNNFVANGIADFFGSTIFHSDVTFSKAPTFSQDTAGYAVIHKGESSATVQFNNAYIATPVVNATLVTSIQMPTTSSTGSGSLTPSVSDFQILQQVIASSAYSYVVTNISTTGFTIVLNKSALSDVAFSWNALFVPSVTPVPPQIFSQPTNTQDAVAGATTQGVASGEGSTSPVATSSGQ